MPGSAVDRRLESCKEIRADTIVRRGFLHAEGESFLGHGGVRPLERKSVCDIWVQLFGNDFVMSPGTLGPQVCDLPNKLFLQLAHRLGDRLQPSGEGLFGDR